MLRAGPDNAVRVTRKAPTVLQQVRFGQQKIAQTFDFPSSQNGVVCVLRTAQCFWIREILISRLFKKFDTIIRPLADYCPVEPEFAWIDWRHSEGNRFSVFSFFENLRWSLSFSFYQTFSVTQTARLKKAFQRRSWNSSNVWGTQKRL